MYGEMEGEVGWRYTGKCGDGERWEGGMQGKGRNGGVVEMEGYFSH